MNESLYDLAAMERRWDEKWLAGRANKRETWDAGAPAWDEKLRREGIRKKQGEERVRDTVAWLTERGALFPGCAAADVGCGPGRFAAAFAETAGFVLGTDLSPVMAEYGRAYARERGLQNVEFRALDFQTADIAALGWQGRFDLAFSSITPAVRGLRGLDNLMAMSRGFCFNASFVRARNDLDQALRREVLDTDPDALHTTHSHWFYELFNLLWLRGYCPETRYYRQERDLFLPVTAETARLVAARLLPEGEAARWEGPILRYLEEHALPDGTVEERSDFQYGWTLWDLRERR